MFNHVLRSKKQKSFIFTSKVNSSDLKRDLEIIFSTNLKWKNQVIDVCMYVLQMYGKNFLVKYLKWLQFETGLGLLNELLSIKSAVSLCLITHSLT